MLTAATILFSLLTATMVVFLHNLLKDLGMPMWTSIAVVLWLLLLGGLSFAGFFSDFTPMPPRMLLAFIVPVVGIIMLARNKKAGSALQAMPAQRLILFQSFRIVVEICLFMMFLAGSLPALMTPEGRNFDVLVGLTAFFAARWAMHPQRRSWIIVWNVFGLLLLTNVVVHALLAAPTPLQRITTDPPLTIVATFPFIWLPGFLVPMALLGHVLSLKKTLSTKS